MIFNQTLHIGAVRFNSTCLMVAAIRQCLFSIVVAIDFIVTDNFIVIELFCEYYILI